jgi:hypothetical protein
VAEIEILYDFSNDWATATAQYLQDRLTRLNFFHPGGGTGVVIIWADLRTIPWHRVVDLGQASARAFIGPAPHTWGVRPCHSKDARVVAARSIAMPAVHVEVFDSVFDFLRMLLTPCHMHP